VTSPANSFAETTESGTAARMDRTQGWPEASAASRLTGLAASLGFAARRGVASSPANHEAFRMTFIRSIFFCSAMIP
jgi:hypothetical protein